MHIKHPLTGAMVALITPMFEDGSVDFDALANLVEFHIQRAPVNGCLICIMLLYIKNPLNI
jgi:dihydrodipicolinate synthase/N-acetylneuraminate lyase